MTNYRILDLDNCIADDRDRIPLIDWSLPPGNARYDAYHARCAADPIGNADLTHVPKGTHIVIMTGRPLKFIAQTERWLTKHHVDFAHLLMRPNHDERPSALVKEQQLGWLLGHYEVDLREITSAFDDHPEIIAMYERHGIPATQVSIHTVSAYLNPYTKEPAL